MLTTDRPVIQFSQPSNPNLRDGDKSSTRVVVPKASQKGQTNTESGLK